MSASRSELELQVASLQAQVAALQAQLAALQVEQAQPDAEPARAGVEQAQPDAGQARAEGDRAHGAPPTQDRAAGGGELDGLGSAQEMLQLVMDTIPQFVFWKDRDSVYQGCNRIFAEIAGFDSVAEVIGKTDHDMVWKPSETEFFLVCDKRVMESDTAEYHIIEPQLQADGKQAWLDTNKVPLHDGQGRVVGILGTFEDITARKQAEDAIAESEENLRITLHSIGDAVIATDARGHITRVNPVAEALTGWTQADAVGRPLMDVFRLASADPRAPHHDPVSRVLQTGETVGLGTHTLLIGKDGTERQIADSGAPIRNRQGQIVGVVLVFRDVTEQLAVEAQLRQSQKMEAIGQLAGGVAHDFNNVLGGILGAAEVLEQQIGADADARRLLDLITESSQRAAALTHKLLTFARKQPAATRELDLHALLRTVLELLEQTIDRRISIRTRLEAGSARIVGDPSLLESAFLNLGINAAHAMPEGGSLHLSTREVELDGAYCAASPFELEPGPFLQVDVRDSGCGITADDLPRIFEPFFTTRPPGEGTGLGLSAVYGTLQQHRGAVTVYSEPGSGTSFQLMLPLARVPEVPPPARDPAPIPGSGRILVVDDDQAMRVTARSLLQRLGYEVLLAEDGARGLELFAAQRERIDLVLLDMIMPAMNGRDCFAALRALSPRLPVVLSSGFAREEDLKQMRADGLAGFLRKPYSSAQLSHAVHEALSRATTRG